MPEYIESNDKEVIMKEFQTRFDAGEMFLICFTGGVDPTSGESWCPDCVVAKPAMERIKAKTQLPFIMAILQGRNDWVGVSDHPYRKHPHL